ncbi:hypothetical protein K431DRAFT_307119 [Polychaeton citri CBS 116435]|uniref:GPI anchored protein n=1 Tax=Polychaeton citri CBS 116435 TaxID=1314669 RepID=A0A9P4Q0F9_9PEZI|nr:hypothetical protein K431DRAFT_307119 [Polychaeton citri CBS 116435]
MLQNMVWLAAWTLCFGITAAKRPTYTKGNGTANVEGLLMGRNLLQRQSCGAGYGQCDKYGQCCPLDAGCCGVGCIAKENTCCDGGLCPPNNSCCYGSCCPPDWGCCTTDGSIYPLDGSDCCSDGGHCDPGERCGSCDDGTGEICCYGTGDDSTATYFTYLASITEDYGESYTSDTGEYSSVYLPITTSSDDYTYHSVHSVHSTFTPASYFTTIYTYYWLTYYVRTNFRSSESVFSSFTSSQTTLSVYATDVFEADNSFYVMESSVDRSASAAASSQGASMTLSINSAEGGQGPQGIVNAAPGVNSRLGYGFVGAGLVIGALAVLL